MHKEDAAVVCEDEEPPLKEINKKCRNILIGHMLTSMCPSGERIGL